MWKVTVGGTVNAVNYAIGDSIVYSKALGSYYKIDSTDQVSSVNGMSGAVTVTTITGNAGTATKLATARSISTSGDITWSVSFDGSANVTAAATLATVATPGTYNSVTVDAKGRVISGTNPSILATEEEVVARIEATKAVTPATLNAVVPYSPNINPTLDLDFANQVYRHFEGPDGLVSHPLTPFVTFTRSSTATYFDAMGVMRQAANDTPRIDYDPATGECKGLLIEEQRTNLFRSSNYFGLASSTWNKSGSLCKNNETLGPDGLLSGHKIVESSGVGIRHGIYNVGYSITLGSTGNKTVSFVLKPGERTSISMVAYGTGMTTVSSSAIAIASGTPLSNGFYKVSWTFNVDVVPPTICIELWMLNQSNTLFYDGDGVSGMYIYSAQLEEGAFPTSYIPTPATFTGRASTKTYFDSNGVLQTAASGVAVTDYGYVDGRWVSKGLSLEPQATNLLLHSSTSSSWAIADVSLNLTAEVNNLLAPDNTVSATKITTIAASGYTFYRQGLSLTAGTTYTASVHVKRGNYRYIGLRGASNDLGFDHCVFDFDTESFVWQPATEIVSKSFTRLNNGWFRLAVTILCNTSENRFVGVAMTDAVGSENVSIPVGSYTYVWGAQLETGPVATSYIPTTTAQVTRAADTSTSAQTTRAADNAVISGTNFSQWFRVDEYSLFAEFVTNSLNAAGYDSIAELIKSSSSRVGMYVNKNVSNIVTIDMRTATANKQTNSPASCLSNSKNKTVFSLNRSTIRAATNGSVSADSAVIAIPLDINQLIIGKYDSMANMCIRSLKYYPKALTSAELQAMTA